MTSFIELVREMREAQKKYFATGNKEALSWAITTEARVDRELHALDKSNQCDQTQDT